MKCNICGRDYIALGVHLRHKHKIAPSDYKEEYGLLLATPLVDDWLSERIRASQNTRLKDPEYKAELQDRCRSNAAKNVGKPGAGMTQAGKGSIARSDKERNQKYLEKQAVNVAKVLLEKGTMLDVRRATGTGPIAGRKMADIAGVAYSKESAKIERDKRAAATTRAKALARVAKVMPYFETTKSAAEMCRLAGVSIKTYKNWLAAGLISRHPNGRGKQL
jgi:hypothetical protein